MRKLPEVLAVKSDLTLLPDPVLGEILIVAFFVILSI